MPILQRNSRTAIQWLSQYVNIPYFPPKYFVEISKILYKSATTFLNYPESLEYQPYRNRGCWTFFFNNVFEVPREVPWR